MSKKDKSPDGLVTGHADNQGSGAPGDATDQEVIQGALASLSTWKNIGSSNRTKVPFPVDMDPPFALHKGDFHGAHHEKVLLSDLTATQPTVNRKRVAKFIHQNAKYSKIPRVVKVHGRLFVANGHHRLAADYLLGKKHARVNLLNLGDGS